MNSAYEELLRQVHEAIRETMMALRTEHRAEALAGYALLTDDDLSTLGYLAVTQEALIQNPEPDLLFCPTDWPYEPRREAFRRPDRSLRRLADAGDSELHVDEAFGTLVRALAEARLEHQLGPEVFLTVLSTDPSDYLEELETNAVGQLNSKAIVEQRTVFLEKWAR